MNIYKQDFLQKKGIEIFKFFSSNESLFLKCIGNLILTWKFYFPYLDG